MKVKVLSEEDPPIVLTNFCTDLKIPLFVGNGETIRLSLDDDWVCIVKSSDKEIKRQPLYWLPKEQSEISQDLLFWSIASYFRNDVYYNQMVENPKENAKNSYIVYEIVFDYDAKELIMDVDILDGNMEVAFGEEPEESTPSNYTNVKKLIYGRKTTKKAKK